MKSASMPSLQVGLLAHEAGVGVEVVDRALAPQRVAARRRAPARSGRRARRSRARRSRAPRRPRGSARRWPRVKYVVGVGARVVGAQVQVVVGQHRRRSLAQRELGDPQVAGRRDLQVLARRRRRPARRRPPRSTSQASSVAAASTSSGASSARSSAARRKTCGVCTAHSVERSSVRTTSPSARLLDRVGHRRGGDRPRRSRARPARRAPPRKICARHERPRGVVDDHRVALARAAARRSTDCERCAPPGTPIVPAGASRARGQRDDDRARPRRPPAAPSMLHSSIGRPASTTNALGPSDPRRSPRPAATTSATATWSPPRRRCRRAGRRGAARPRPRPCRARTSARTRGSSSPA